MPRAAPMMPKLKTANYDRQFRTLLESSPADFEDV
jgi:hypothetical protein